jgi:predicted DNA repair protein MutK
MTDKAAGLFIAPLLMLIGLWLCLEGVEHGKLNGIESRTT